MSDRLTRKEIKHDIREDEVRHVLEDVFFWLQDNAKLVVGLLVVLVAAVLLGFAGRSYLAAQADEASAELSAAIDLLAAPIVAEGETPEDPDEPYFASEEERQGAAREAFEGVKAKLGSSVAGDIAGLFLADFAIDDGDAATARSTWQAFLDDHQGHALAMSVRLNLIRLDRQEGRGAELIEELRSELASSRQSLPEDALLFELGRTLEHEGREDEALEVYQQLIDEHPTSPFVGQARELTTAAS